MVGIISVDEILHDGAALEQADLLAIGEGVRQGWNTPIGVDVEEPLLLLSAVNAAVLPAQGSSYPDYIKLSPSECSCRVRCR